MGRTLHWDIIPKNKPTFSLKDLKTLRDVGDKIAKSNKWTCETFSLDIGIYPNWNTKQNWDIVKREWDNLASQGRHPTEIEIELTKKGITLFHNENYKRELHGFCKVGRNEQNACAVIVGLTVASIEVNCSIWVSDEGKFLKCPIVIEKGKARPDYKTIKLAIGDWLSRGKRDDAYKDLADRFEMLAKGYYDISKKYRSQYYPPMCEWDVEIFCRKVNAQDFVNHPEYNAAQIMGGFYGEYWKLNGEHDAEKESYLMSDMIKKMLPEGCSMQVTPKLNIK